MKKILCIGDSLALPGHLNAYEDTWFYKVKLAFPNFDFISFFKRQLTTDVLTTMGGGEGGVDKWPKGADCFEAFLPDIIILQLGIVDCAPRLLGKKERLILEHLPGLIVNPYIKMLKFIRKRSTSNTLVPFEKFCSNLERYLIRVKYHKTKVIIITISIPDIGFINKNPNILDNVVKYNTYLTKLSKIYPFVTCTLPLNPIEYSTIIYEDGYHPNEIGHHILFEKLRSLLELHI